MRKKIKVQLAIQGGGAKIFALVAAIKALQELEEEGVLEVTRVAGSSAGAIVASLYAAEVAADQMVEHFKDIPQPFLKRRSKLRSLAKILSAYFFGRPFYKEDHLIKKLEQVPAIKGRKKIKDVANNKKLFITKSDIITGKNLISSENDYLIPSIVDSCRIPFVFGGSNIKSEFYDGGITSNLPINHLVGEIDDFGPVIALTFKSKPIKITGDTHRQRFQQILRGTIFSSINSNVTINLDTDRIFAIALDDHEVDMVDFARMAEIFKQETEETISIFNSNYTNAKKALVEDFVHKQIIERESAQLRLNHLQSNIPQLKNKNVGDRILIRYPYTNLPIVEELQKKISQLFLGSNTIRWKEYSPLDLGDEYFDAIQRPEIAILNKAVYLFPFFLSSLRRNYWGAIEYGRHKSLGIIIHPKTSLRSNLGISMVKFLKEHEYKPNQDFVDIKEGDHWIDDLILALYLQSGKLISFGGYLFNEMIPLMLLDSNNKGAFDFFNSVCEVVNPSGSIFDEGLYLFFEELLEKRSISAIDRKLYRAYAYMLNLFADEIEQSVIIFDLAHLYIVQDLLGSKEEKLPVILKINHYLDVKVGIGFSLPTIEKIEEEAEDYWVKAREIALATLSAQEEQLTDIGIEIFKK